MTTDQMEMVSLEQLVSEKHVYRKFMKLLDFTSIAERLQKLENNQYHGAKGYGIEILFHCLPLQFIEDISDRELEKLFGKNAMRQSKRAMKL